MILNENEVKSCLIYICEKFLKDKIKILEADLSINHKISMVAKVIYDHQPFDMSASFFMDYKNKHISVYDIDASVNYLVFQLNFMNLVRHVLKDFPITYTDNTMSYFIDLPIKEIVIGDKEIELKIK